MKKKINPIVKWWVTPKLPYEDIFEKHNFFTQWIIHPIKRRLARSYLRFLKKYTDIKIIGVTGSDGKSTTVQMIYSILKEVDKTVSTPPSIDPVYNIPNTILRTSPRTKFLILEMSVEYKNEMDYYLWLAKPDVALVINIYPTHTQFFGNTKGVYEEKKKIATVLNKDDICILNKENKWTKKIAGGTSAKVLWFGNGSKVNATNIKMRGFHSNFNLNFDGEMSKISMKVPGKIFVENAVAASAVAKALSIDLESIKIGLDGFEAPKQRMSIIKSKKGYVVLDESYNSNPKALEESLKVFVELAKERTKIAVLGDMLELGSLEEKEHAKIGRSLSKMGVDYLVAVGKASEVMAEEASKKMGKTNVFWSENAKGVAKVLEGIPTKNSLILIKGSRSIGLERVVSEIA